MYKEKFFTISLFILNILLLHQNNIHALLYPAAINTAHAVTGALREVYHRRTPDTTMPTLAQLNVICLLPCKGSTKKGWHTDKTKVLEALKQGHGVLRIHGKHYKIYSGIPADIAQQNGPAFIYSGGYSNDGNPYAYCAYTAIKCGLIAGPCITFDYATDTRRAFNFCQKQDIHCLRIVYEDLLKKAPRIPVILHGACKGAMNSLRFLEVEAKHKGYLSNIQGVIAESPVISVKKALSSWSNGGALSHLLCRITLPNYNHKQKTIMQATQFPSSIPILIASLPRDTLSQHADMLLMCQHLRKFSEKITHFTSNNEKIWHGKIGKAFDYGQAVAEFFYNHNIDIRKTNCG